MAVLRHLNTDTLKTSVLLAIAFIFFFNQMVMVAGLRNVPELAPTKQAITQELVIQHTQANQLKRSVVVLAFWACFPLTMLTGLYFNLVRRRQVHLSYYITLVVGLVLALLVPSFLKLARLPGNLFTNRAMTSAIINTFFYLTIAVWVLYRIPEATTATATDEGLAD